MTDIVRKMAEATAQLTAPGAPWELESRIVDGGELRFYKNAPQTLPELINAGRAHGDKEFIIFGTERWTFDQFFARVDAMTEVLLQQYGVRAGDRIAIAMRNYPEWMVAYSAIALAGAIVVPLNSWGQADELVYGLTDSGARIVFCDQRRLDHLAGRLDGLGVEAIVARADSPLPAHARDFDALAASVAAPKPAVAAIDPDDTAQIMYTSGTTGKPKGAESSHRAIGQALYNFEFGGIAAAMTNPGPIGAMLQKGFAPKVMLAVPLFHVSGCYTVFLMSLRAGRPIVVMYKWDVVTALQTIEAERVTMISAVPTMLWDLFNSPHWSEYDTSSLFSIGAGGAAQPPRMPAKIYEKVRDAFPGTGYGMTESNATGFAVTGAAYEHKPLSGGLRSPIVDVRICDENGNVLPRGVPGEIWLRSPTLVKGYWNNPQATAETFRNGWLVTGDVGYYDDEEYIFLTDRTKDMVIRGGENIYSAEIEACVLLHEEVAEVAAFGVPHESLGEELALALTTRPGSALDAAAVQAHVAARLAPFKVPAHVFFHHEPLPRNATQKVMKKLLKQFYSEKLAAR
jgi:long-chain acyl-CoA synthetase